MILVSVGHHKDKQGATYENNGYVVTEYLLANKWVDLVTQLLKGHAMRVPNGTLNNKVKFINRACKSLKGEHIAVELHFNSFKKWKDLNGNGVVDAGEIIALGQGSETLYYPSSKKGEQAAVKVQEALGSLMKPNRGAKQGWYQMNPDKGADFFLEYTDCVSLIVEPEFIDNIEIINNNMSAACHIIATELLELHNNYNN